MSVVTEIIDTSYSITFAKISSWSASLHCGCSKIIIHNNSNNFTTEVTYYKTQDRREGSSISKHRKRNVSYNNFKAIPLCHFVKKKVGVWEEYNVKRNNKTRHNILFTKKNTTDKLCELKSCFKKDKKSLTRIPLINQENYKLRQAVYWPI